MSTAALRTRLTRAARRLAASAPNDYTAHWRRVNDQRMRDLEALAELVPESHLDAFLEATRAIAPDLFVAGPAWLPEEAPAFHRWLMQRVSWGRDHPCNPPFPGEIPAAYLDLLIGHPDAEINSHACGGCGIPVPSTRVSGQPGVTFRWPEPLVAACPVCGAPVPPPRRT